MFKRLLGGSIVVASLLVVGLPAAAVDIPLRNWSAPKSWSPPSESGRAALALTQSYPAAFVPVVPCRVMDTRGNGQTGNFGTPTIGAGVTRTISIPTHPTCTGINSSALAYSLNLTVTNTGSGAYGYLQVWPTGATQPTASNLNYPGPGATLANAAVVQAGTAGQINVFSGNASADVIIDINGYYAWDTTAALGGFEIYNGGSYAIWGQSTATNGIGVKGVENATGGIGVYGTASGTTGIGVKGVSTSYNGVWAQSTSQDGLFSSGGRDGAYITGARYGVYGNSSGTSSVLYGVIGASASTTAGSAGGYFVDSSGGPSGIANAYQGGTSGLIGASKFIGVLGVVNNAFAGVGGVSLSSTTPFASQSSGWLAWSNSQAGGFFGDVFITSSAGGSGNLSVAGTVSKGGGSFKIDHPLDPENKYLYHSFVESPDMMNVYNGMISLDATGSAVVTLPAYFEALNSDFRYQLTAVGSRQPGLYVDQEVANNEFVISGGRPNGKVSWQVTGIRKDPFANANRIIPEVAKEPAARGYYLHPAAYNQPAEKSLMDHLAKTEKAAAAEEAKAQKNDR